MGDRRGHSAHTAHVRRAYKLSPSGLQCVLCLHFFRNITSTLSDIHHGANEFELIRLISDCMSDNLDMFD